MKKILSIAFALASLALMAPVAQAAAPAAPGPEVSVYLNPD